MTAPAPETFDTLFGGGQAAVNFDQAAYVALPILPIPSEDDSLEVTARKLTQLAAVVEEGKSLAIRTGYRGSAHTTRDPIELAKQSMTPMELKQYEAWARGIRMPEVDWPHSREPVKGGDSTRKRFERRARAIGKIWKEEGITSENAMWLTMHRPYVLPLVIAVAKIEAAGMELMGGSNELTEMELAEVQTAHKVVAIATGNMNRVMEQMRRLTARINAAKETIQTREHALKRKIKKYKPKQDQINVGRRYLGLPEFGRDVDYSRATRGTRDVRTDLLGGTGLGATTTRPLRAATGAPPPEAQTAPPLPRPRVVPQPVEEEEMEY